MGVYIKGMEMPKGNDAVSIIIFPNGKVSLANDRRFAEYAEAVPVPPHGDLIDRDAYEYPGDLMDEPVIIPAEEGET